MHFNEIKQNHNNVLQLLYTPTIQWFFFKFILEFKKYYSYTLQLLLVTCFDFCY